MGAKFSRSHAKNFIYFDICDAATISIEYSIENINITHESFVPILLSIGNQYSRYRWINKRRGILYFRLFHICIYETIDSSTPTQSLKDSGVSADKVRILFYGETIISYINFSLDILLVWKLQM